MKFTKILLILLVIFFPFGEIIRFDLGNNIFLKPLDLISVFLLLWITFLYIKNKTFRKSLHWYYFFFPLIGLVSLLINLYWLSPHEFLASFLYLLRWIAYLSIFFAIIQLDDQFKKKITKFLIIDGLIILFIGYIQFFFYPNLRNLYYLGWDEHLYRMFSSFLDPNFAGTFFVLYLIFIAGLLFTKTKKLGKKTLYFYGGLIPITLAAIFLTYSRSALLMLIVSGITFFLLLQKRKFILYLLVSILLFIILISPYFYIENLDLFRVNSSISRILSAQHALQIIQSNPLIGVGFDSYRYAQIRFHLITADPRFPAHSASGDDTSLLFVFATTGIVGLLSYLYLWFRLYKTAKGTYKKNNFAMIFIASGAGMFINSLFINSLFYPEVLFWLWMIAGLMQEKV
jgi:hypothetical protein